MNENIITKYNEFYTHYSIEDFEKLLNSQQRIDKAIEKIETLRMEKWAIMGTDIMDVLSILQDEEMK